MRGAEAGAVAFRVCGASFRVEVLRLSKEPAVLLCMRISTFRNKAITSTPLVHTPRSGSAERRSRYSARRRRLSVEPILLSRSFSFGPCYGPCWLIMLDSLG